MISNLTPIERCQEIAGLAPHEIVLGVAPGEKHERLLAKYRRARRSQTVARAKIVADIRAAVIAGAAREAADLLIVLRRLLSSAPRSAAPPAMSRRLPSCARRIGAGRRPLRREPLRKLIENNPLSGEGAKIIVWPSRREDRQSSSFTATTLICFEPAAGFGERLSDL